MGQRHVRILFVCFVALAASAGLLVAGCGDDTVPVGGDGGPGGDGAAADGTKPAKKLEWVLETVDSERAGFHATLAATPGGLGLAYFRSLADPVQKLCPGASAQKPKPANDLYYVSAGAGGWGSPIQVDQTIGPTYGLSIAVDPSSGEVHLGYLGGALSQVECNSSDAIIASSSDGLTWSKRTLAAAGPIGDTVGYWMAIALDAGGAVHGAYGDVRFGYYEQDGKQKASLRYDAGEAIVENNGAGVYNSLVIDSQGTPIVAFYNPMQKGAPGGIQLAVKEGGVWKTQQIVGGATSERLSLATDGRGLFGVSYYEPTMQLLRYVESAKDFTDWVDVKVDPSLTNNGEYSSLAFDSKGNPAISYYRCGAYGKNQCDLGKDGAMFAYRIGGSWTTYQVDMGAERRCGTYTSLAFDSHDLPVIAYQCVALDNLSNEFVDTVKVAQGVYR